MEQKQLTPEQQEKIAQLRKQMLRKAAINGAKFGGCILLANLLVSMINVFFVQSDGFQFVGVLVSFMILFNSFSRQAQAERDRIKEELDKILS